MAVKISELVEKQSLGISDYLVVDNGVTTNKVIQTYKQNATDNSLTTTSKTIVGAINEVNELARGRSSAVSYANYQTMVSTINPMSSTSLRAGDNIYIVTLNVPDLWVVSIESTSVPYTYTTDEALMNDLTTNSYIQCGYYKLSPLEAEKIDLSGYLQKSSTANIIYGTTNSGTQTTYSTQQLRDAVNSYTSIAIATTDVVSLACTKTLTDATANSHPMISPLTQNAATKEAEITAFSKILYCECGVNSITLHFSEAPAVDFVISVKGW